MHNLLVMLEKSHSGLTVALLPGTGRVVRILEEERQPAH